MIDTRDLLRRLQEAQDVEIGRLMDEYGMTLEDVRAMRPQLQRAIDVRRRALFPQEPVMLSLIHI